MNRKRFLQQTVLAGAGIISLPQVAFSNTIAGAADPFPAEKIKEFVSAGHNNLEKVKLLQAEFPTLIYAAWDLGGGDFETALEGAIS